MPGAFCLWIPGLLVGEEGVTKHHRRRHSIFRSVAPIIADIYGGISGRKTGFQRERPCWPLCSYLSAMGRTQRRYWANRPASPIFGRSQKIRGDETAEDFGPLVRRKYEYQAQKSQKTRRPSRVCDTARAVSGCTGTQRVSSVLTFQGEEYDDER
jgi:hypothetical protein